MNNFSYVKAASVEDALRELGEVEQGRILAGGTDLIPLMKDEIVSAGTLIDISRLQGGGEIREEGSDLRIGALATLNSIANNRTIKEQYTALAGACESAATEQLRNMGTLGGNLLQQTRCWYYRGPYNCWLKGGDTCYARHGENEHHAIFNTQPGESPCVSAHPSDPAAALLALGARIVVQKADNTTEMPLDELFALPEQSRRSAVTLPENAIITHIVLPLATANTRSVYLKAMPRAAWAFALAGVAIKLEAQGDRIANARVALSGVSPIPFRAREVEAALNGDRNAIKPDELAALLVAEARPLSQNGYKVSLLKGLFKEALTKVLNS